MSANAVETTKPDDAAHESAGPSGRRRRYLDMRVGLPAAALLIMLLVIFVMQPWVLTYNGLRILLGFAIPLIFAAMAQLCIIAVSDTDFGLGPFISPANCIAAAFFATQPLLGVVMLTGCVLVYAGMGAFIQFVDCRR